MTDNEIIKALECCEGDDGISYCNKCSLYEYDNCIHYISQKAREVINRQKAEIDELNHDVEVLYRVKEQLKDMYKTAKSEAYKEFAERLKEMPSVINCEYEWLHTDIDNLVKEMEGADK